MMTLRVALALLLLTLASAARAERVDLELVLAVDVSGSIDPVEAALQRQGYIAALTDPRVIRAIQSGATGAIALIYIEWAGAEYQRTIVPWTTIRGPDDAARFTAAIAAAPARSA